MQTSSAGLNRNVRGAPEYCACAGVGAATARQDSSSQLAITALIWCSSPLSTQPFFTWRLDRRSLAQGRIDRPRRTVAQGCVDTRIFSLSLEAAVSTSKPLAR